jgi:AbrB family looped-hinge helix DNA binding protein
MKPFQATISSKGQVTIPADIRLHLGVSAGDRIWFIVTDEGTVEVRAGCFTLEEVIGSIEALPGESGDLDREIREATEEAMARKMRRWSRQ